jgi:hypothetical protein
VKSLRKACFPHIEKSITSSHVLYPNKIFKGVIMPDPKNLRATQKQALLYKLKWIYDPVPPWIRLNVEKLKQFEDIQQKFNEKITEIEIEKMAALEKITGKIL